jgi:alpha-beta hydrolase superfamily lysophospholipase
MLKCSSTGEKVTEHERVVLKAADGHEIRLQIWRPDTSPTHAIQILHGLGEHADRYARFAEAATARGMVVFSHDHRGHGPNADQLGYFAGKDGWNLLISDAHAVHREILRLHEGPPIALIGHSMGSYVAQSFLMRHMPKISALILSASTWPSRAQLLPALLLAKFECARLGRHRESALLDQLGFGNFNKPFRPERTKSDWLSRDEGEVDKYIADPHCGGPYTAGLWADLIGGLLEISSDSALQRVAADLPILITGGEKDPVGGDKGMTKLLTHYAQTGHQRLRVKIYPDGRHEMLNETNRDDVMRDWLDWIETTSRTGH